MTSSVHIPSLIIGLGIPSVIILAVAWAYLRPVIKHDIHTIATSFAWHPLIFILAALLSGFMSPLTDTPNPEINPQLALAIINLLFIVGIIGGCVALFKYPSSKSFHQVQFIQVPVVAYLWFVCMIAITHDGP